MRTYPNPELKRVAVESFEFAPILYELVNSCDTGDGFLWDTYKNGGFLGSFIAPKGYTQSQVLTAAQTAFNIRF